MYVSVAKSAVNNNTGDVAGLHILLLDAGYLMFNVHT